MKLLIVVLAIIVEVVMATLTPERVAEIRTYVTECKQETGVDQDLIEKVKNGIFVEDDKLKKFLSCSFTKAGIQDKDGHVLVDKYKATWPNTLTESERQTIESTCMGKTGATPGDTMYLVYKCFRETSPHSHAKLI